MFLLHKQNQGIQGFASHCVLCSVQCTTHLQVSKIFQPHRHIPLVFEASLMVLFFHFRRYGHGKLERQGTACGKGDYCCKPDTSMQQGELKRHEREKNSRSFMHLSWRVEINPLQNIFLHGAEIIRWASTSSLRGHNLQIFSSTAFLVCLHVLVIFE